MLRDLSAYIEQTVFLVWGATSTRKLIFPKSWASILCRDRSHVLSELDSNLDSGKSVVILVSEGDFLSAVEILQRRERQQPPSATSPLSGIAVLSSRPDAFLEEKSSFKYLLDVLPEKDIRKYLPLYLLKTLRLLMLSDERENPRLGRRTLEQLNQIFIALSGERDPQRLLATILVKAIDLLSATSGMLYMAEEKDGELSFRLRILSDRATEVSFEHLTQRVIENSISGYVALTGKTVNIPDIGDLGPMALPQFTREVDHGTDGQTRSILCVPLKNSRNEITAVLQLIDRKSPASANPRTTEGKDSSSVFSLEDESLLSSFATQAAICLENVDLYADIQRLFEGFIKASITAIESRDPSTGGHSERVAKLSVGLARATSDCQVGVYRSVKFKEEEVRELEYAALLHDFGKIGVREEVLVKAKKLYPYQLEAIRERIKICKAAAKIAYLERKLLHGADSAAEEEYQRRLRDIDEYWEIIQSANEPSLLKVQSKQSLERIRTEQMLLPDGTNIAVLTEDEYQALAVSRGSLTEMERMEIESHVRHTYQFLKMIPWTKDFRHLTEIAYCHHEKLDGTGYPRGLVAHEIPLQSKIMTISDIFDALTAADRWYKEAVPTERAIEILAQEVGRGQLDPVLFELFVEKKIFELTHPKSSTKVA